MGKYFTTVKDKIIFTNGHTLKAYIPKRYENRGLLIFEEPIKVFGIFEIDILDSNGKVLQNKGLILPGMISTLPEKRYSETRRNIDCYVFEYTKDQVFLFSNLIIKQPKLTYSTFVEMISLGNMPAFLSYSQVAFLFDSIIKYTGSSIKVDHAIFELIYSHLFRDAENTSVKYRHTDMKNPPVFIALRSVSEGPDSSMAKIYGSYSGDGLNSALVDEIQDMSDLENLIRS